MSQEEVTRYKIEMRPSAVKALSKLPNRIQQAIDEKILSLRDNPRPHGAVLLSASERLYRVRTGDHRIIYQISDDLRHVTITKIGDRRDVYRNLN